MTPDGTAYPPQHFAEGIGFSVDMAVQDAARHALTMLRYSYPAFDDNPFRYCPSSDSTFDWCFTHTYADSSQEGDPRLRCSADIIAAYTRWEREQSALIVTLATRLRNLTNRLRPYLENGPFPSTILDDPPIVMSPLVASPDVGGTVPPRGRIRMPRVVRGVPQSPHAPQDESVRHYRGAPVPLPFYLRGY